MNYINTLLYSLYSAIESDSNLKTDLMFTLNKLFSDHNYKVNFQINELNEELSQKYQSISRIYKSFYEKYTNGVDLIADRYKYDFEEIEKLGKGSFGSVYKVRSKFDGKEYAIKRVEPQLDSDCDPNKKLKEIKLCASLNNDNIVRYMTAWHGFNFKHNPPILVQEYYIQMELCDTTLEKGLQMIDHEFDQSCEKGVSLIGAFLASEMFAEIVSGVDYMHSQNPPIIHRDLKLKNILLVDGINGKFIKICDFGLATMHDIEQHTRLVGTKEYMAPEIFSTKNYNEKADIYSMGIILKKLFCIQSNPYGENFDTEKYKDKKNYSDSILDIMQSIHKLLNNLLQKEWQWRYTCKEILAIKCDWTVSYNKYIKQDSNFSRIYTTWKDDPEVHNKNIIYKILVKKLDHQLNELNNYNHKTPLLENLWITAETVQQDSQQYYSKKMQHFVSSSAFQVDLTVFSDYHTKCLNECIDRQTSEHNKILIESFSNLTAKLFSSNKLDLTNKVNFSYKNFCHENSLKPIPTVLIQWGAYNLLSSVFTGKSEPVMNESNEELRPNCIVLDGSVLIGEKAKLTNHMNCGQQSAGLFDTKQLLGKDRDSHSSEELSKYPFDFVDNQLSVKATLFDCDYLLRIETVNALLLLDIKLDAERQFNYQFRNTVIAIPTYFNERQKQGVRNAAKIVGFDNVSTLSELTAMAINYCETNAFEKHVLFAVIHGSDCEAALCLVNSTQIQYIAYENTIQSLNNNNSIDCDPKLFIDNFEILVNMILQTACLERFCINDVVIAGETDVIVKDVQKWSSKYFECEPQFNDNPLDIITNGLAIYSQSTESKPLKIEIKEVSTHTYSCECKSSCHLKGELIAKNTSLPFESKSRYDLRQFEPPFDFFILQNDDPICKFHVKEFPVLNGDRWAKLIPKLIVNAFGDTRVKPKIVSRGKSKFKLTLNLLELSVAELNMEREKVMQIREKLLKVKRQKI